MNQESVYIVGGGTSLNGYDFKRLETKDVIVVNKSIFSVPTAKYFVTMDYTFLHKINSTLNHFRSHPASKFFILNMTKSYIQEIDGAIQDVRSRMIYNLQDFDVIIKSRKTSLLGTTFNDFHNGENSAYCALQLAIVLGYKNIYLLGVDLQCGEQTHFHGGYKQDYKTFKKNLDNYYEEFINGIKYLKKCNSTINIINCSNISRLKMDLPFYSQDNIC